MTRRRCRTPSLPPDRAHRFYAHERSQAHAMLAHVLLTYERYNQVGAASQRPSAFRTTAVVLLGVACHGGVGSAARCMGVDL